MTGWLFCILYLFTAIFMVPPRKQGKGIATRAIARIVPPKRFWKSGVAAIQYRYWLWFMLTWPLELAGVLSKGVWADLFWIPVTVLLLDDLVNGDEDDRRRRWEGVKNKVKWLMELPPTPVEIKEGSA